MPQAKITIELTADVRGSGSAMPDVAHDAWAFRKLIPEVIWQSRDGEDQFRMGDRWQVTAIRCEQAITEEPKS